jgi:hypothetical protein
VELFDAILFFFKKKKKTTTRVNRTNKGMWSLIGATEPPLKSSSPFPCANEVRELNSNAAVNQGTEKSDKKRQKCAVMRNDFLFIITT